MNISHFNRIKHNLVNATKDVRTQLIMQNSSGNINPQTFIYPSLEKLEKFETIMKKIDIIKSLDYLKNFLEKDKKITLELFYENILLENELTCKIKFLKNLYHLMVFITITEHPNRKLLLNHCQNLLVQINSLF